MTEPELLPSNEIKSEPEAQPVRSRAPLWLACFLLLLISAAIAGAGSWFYVNAYQPLVAQVEDQRAAVNTMTSLESEQLRLQATLRDIEDTLKSSDAKNQDIQATLSNLAKQTAQIDQQLSQMDGARASDWLLGEAIYLIRMAGRKVWLEGDIKTAQMMLTTADSRLEEVADPALLETRRAIANDMQVLEQVNPVSTTSVALSLSGMVSTVPTLPLNTIDLPAASSSGPEPVSEDISEWRTNLGRIWHALMDDFIKIRHREAEVAPMLSATQAYVARQQLTLSLMQAQSAALKNNNTLFQESMKQSIAVLIEHFDIQHHKIEQLVDALNHLQSTDVSRVLPAALQSLDVLERFIERRATRIQQPEALTL